MKKNLIFLATFTLVMGLGAVKAISAQESQTATAAKSVAWYVANLKEARSINQQCHDNPVAQNTTDCSNALHALEITFKGGN